MSHEGKKTGGNQTENGRTSDLLAFLPSHLFFFVLSFVYLWLVVEPHLIYYGFGTLLPDAPQFITGWSFFQDSLSLPGGPVIYASAFLSQGYCHSWLGALIIVLAGFCLGELSRRHLRRAACPRDEAPGSRGEGKNPAASRPAGPAPSFASILAPLPAIMLFLIYSHYNHPLTICLAVSVGLLLSLIFERGCGARVRDEAGGSKGEGCHGQTRLAVNLKRSALSEEHSQTSLAVAPGGGTGSLPQALNFKHQTSSRGPLWPPVRVVAYCLMAAVGLWVGGAGTVLVFALLTIVYGLLLHRDWMTAALVLPASVAIAWALAQYVFLIPTHKALLVLTPFWPSATTGMDTLLKVLVFLLYGFVPAAVLLLVARASRPCVARPSWPRSFLKTRAGRPRDARARCPRHWALSAIPIVLLTLGLYVSHKELRKPYVLSNFYSRQKSWDKIIELGNRLPKGEANAFVSHDILRALYHTGRLPYDMFRYPLIPAAILLAQEKTESDLTQLKLSDIFLELGHVNMAQKLASELLTTKGHLGIALEKLGWIHIIKGQPRTAWVYLEALRKDPIYRGRAEALLRALDSGFAPDQAAYIDRIRSYMRDETVKVTGTEAVDETLAALLEHNPCNKMAFEYLMACYLLTGRVDKIVDNIGRLDDLGYRAIPTLYEEAILVYHGLHGQKLDVSKFKIDPETIQRYVTFIQIRNSMGPQNRSLVLNRLVREFGSSYFFYFTFGRVGLS